LNVIGGSSLIISRIILESVTLQQTPHQRPWLENHRLLYTEQIRTFVHLL
jgi:hypothetical protein